MQEIFGVVSLNAKMSKGEIKSPFNKVEVFQKFDFKEIEISSQKSSYTIAFDRNEPEVFSSDNVQIIIYGKCYTRLNDTTFEKNKLLTASELAELYKNKQKEFVNHVKGSFAIVVNDLMNETINIYTDPLNVHNIFYVKHKNQFLFSSSLTTLCSYLRESNHILSINQQSFVEQTLFNIILDNRTLVNEIYEVAPGTEVSISQSEVCFRTYFDAFERFKIDGPKFNEKESIKQLKELFTQNIKLYTQGPKNTAVAITGGYDSRTIVSLLGEKRSQYNYYSYGLENSWDISIPKKITSDLKLSYNPILLNNKFEKDFTENGRIAALLGDGVGEISHANIIYVYSNFFKRKNSILTGLFGSELIKNPTSLGYFINKNVYNVLFAENLENALFDIGEEAIKENRLTVEMFDQNKNKILQSIEENKYLTNKLPRSKKLFYYLLMLGMRKYFTKEIKIQRNWVSNLHPYFDIDFISKLLETPFPWVYNYTQKKNLIKNLSIHKLYAYLINTNKTLLNTISTHGFRPKYLLKNYYLPLLAIEYYRTKKLISKQSTYDLNPILNKEKTLLKAQLERNASPFFKQLLDNKNLNIRETSKIMSIQIWLQSVGLTL